MTVIFRFEGNHIPLASEKEIEAGTIAAKEVFAQNQADPIACAEAQAKLERDELMTREEALLCVIWEEANDAAFRQITLGWLIRGDVDIKMVISSETAAAEPVAVSG
ncbi:MAG: hypothetical protein WC782_16245 [Methylococcaceae bacterium]|jgi:hypothetical protein